MSEHSFIPERKRLADQVADHLMALIGTGRLKPGDKLPSEPELMKQFQVGRSSIREAIGALSLVGLVTVKPGQGTHVAGFSSENQSKPIGLLGIGRERIDELVEARVELECVIVRFAAERATSEDLEEIRKVHQRMKEARNSEEKLIKLDLAFHMAVARACRNSVLVRFLTEMRQPIRLWMEQKARFDWGYEKVYEQHDLILRAIESGNGSEAEAALISHLRSTGERLVAALMDEKEES
jgi:GntR family transcriptional repressor for pyruvate dehydrogenase complex